MRWCVLLILWTGCEVEAQSGVTEKDLSHVSGASNPSANGRAIDRWSFSGTQEWEPKFLAYTKKRAKYLPLDWKKKIIIPAPPKNSSERTKAELEYLTTLTTKRRDAKGEIEAEVINDNLKWGEYTYKTLTKGARYPQTSKLILATYEELAIVCFYSKQRFNRVRPSILASKMRMKLGTVVKIPNHPAYPSGHSIEAFTFAYILQVLDPKNAESFRVDATRIAHNREIGGLHYPSDSEAGRQIARQLVDLLLENEEYQLLIERARSEW